MIILRGWGILVLVIAALFQFIGYGISSLIGMDSYSDAAKITGDMLFLPAAIVLWIVGKRLNKPKVYVDEAGQQVVSKGRHSLFFIPIEYWAFIYVVLSIGLIIAQVVQ
jgi:hypothetical protein